MSDLISREEAINLTWRDTGYTDAMNAMTVLRERLQQLSSIQQWIPVTKKPPEEKNKYLICTDSGYICECRWTNVNTFWSHLTSDWHWNIFDIPQYSKVVAWMPLPELPELDQEEYGNE